uniref:Uncharacterized protein n=1 Tax=viral metagenome TaxID=1070528 RepID=A0A6C0JQJ7_9ZZZZ
MICSSNSMVKHKPVNRCSTSCCDIPSSFFNQLGIQNNDFTPFLFDTINVGVTPSGMATWDRYLYVANNNNYAIANQDSVTVIDLSTNLPVTTIHHPSFNQPYTITINGNKGYVTNSEGSTITIIDLLSNTVSGVITGFDGPSGMTINDDGTGYVNNYGSSTGIFTASISGTTMTVTNVASGSINLGMQITTSGSFTGSITGTVLTITHVTFGVLAVGAAITGAEVITPTTITSFGTGVGGLGTYNVADSQSVASSTIASNGAAGLAVTAGTVITGYGTGLAGGIGTYTVSPSQTVGSTTIGAVTPGVGSGSGNTVIPVNLSNNTLGSPITVGLAPAAITSGDGTVYTINYVDGNPGTGSISKIVNNVATTILTGLDGPFGIVLSPDSNTAYITNFGSNNFMPFGTTVAIVDLVGHTIVAKIPTGIQPSGVALSGRYLYVSNYNTLYTDPSFTNLVAGQGTVSIIDLYTNTVVGPTIAVGMSPDYIVIVGKYLFVSNYTSNTISVVQIAE